ncbi:MAG: type II toxin-antitoxin system VapC family toxin [Opitutales bacterium]
MKLLLDTCSLLWALQAPEHLSEGAKAALLNANNPVFVSAVSYWEISLKAGLGRLCLTGAGPEAFPDFVADEGWTSLPLDADTAATYGRLPKDQAHKDPFDRMLIHLAIRESFYLISPDRALGRYRKRGLKVCW